MSIVKYLAALAELQDEHGSVTALDGKAEDLFVGTDQGYVLHYRVEVEHENDDQSYRKANRDVESVGNVVAGSEDALDHDDENVFTSLLGGIQVSSEREPVSFLQCSQKHSLLFVLCDDRLVLLEVGTWRELALAVSSYPLGSSRAPQVPFATPQDHIIARFCIVDGVSAMRLEELRQQHREKHASSGMSKEEGSEPLGTALPAPPRVTKPSARGGSASPDQKDEDCRPERTSAVDLPWDQDDVVVMVLAALDKKGRKLRNAVEVIYLAVESENGSKDRGGPDHHLQPAGGRSPRIMGVKVIHTVEVVLGPPDVVPEALSPVGEQGVVIRWRKGLKFLRLERNDGDIADPDTAPQSASATSLSSSSRRCSGAGGCRGGGGDPALWPLPLPIAIRHSPQALPPLISVSRDGELAVCVEDVIFTCSLGNAFASRHQSMSRLGISAPPAAASPLTMGLHHERKEDRPHPPEEINLANSSGPSGSASSNRAPRSRSPSPKPTSLETTPQRHHPPLPTPAVLADGTPAAASTNDCANANESSSRPNARTTAPLILSWNRSRRVEQETIRCIAVHYPHILQFSGNTCNIVDAIIPQENFPDDARGKGGTGRQNTKSVHIPQVSFVVSPCSARPYIFAASRRTLWMIVMESMPSQWASLVETNQMYTALRWCEREWSRGFVPPTTLQLMEEELRYRAGFQLLYSGRIREGMDFLEGATRLDVRELCRLVPECLPVVKDSGGPNPGRYDDHHPWPTTTESSRGVHHCDGRPVSNGKGKGDAAKVVHFLPAEPETDYWAEWHPTPFNAHPDRLEASWCEGYRSRQRRGLQNESSTASGPLSTTTNKPASLYAFLEDCWCELKERVEAMLQKYSADQDRHHDALCPAQSRAAAYALLVLALERRDWSAAHACCLSPHLFLSDVHDLLSSLGEYRLLACVLWRAGYYSEADRLMQSRLYLSGLLSQAHHVVQGRSNALETDNSDVSKKLPLCVTAELTCPVFVKKNSGISTNTTASECSAVPQRPAPQEPSPLVRVGAVGVGWLALPQKLRELTAVHLLGLFDSFDDAVDNSYCSGFCSSSPSTTAVNHTNLAHGNTTDSSHSYVNGSAADTRATKRENHRVELEGDRIHYRTELAVEDWWIHRVAARNQHRQQQALATLKALEERVTVSEALWGGGGNQRDAACSVFSSNPVGERRDALSANERNRGRLPLPSTLALELLLLDHVDLDALRLRFAEDPSRVCLIDGEGSGLLLLAFGLLLQRGRAHRRDPSADSSSEVEDSLRECLREAVMCAVECLLDAGCPTDCINVHGWSCLDILTVADPFHADEFVAALLSVKDVSACLNEEERG